MRRLWVVNGAILLVVLLAAGGTTYALTRSSSSTDSSLRTTPVGRGTVAETVTAAGTVTTGSSATLNFSVSGRIAEVRVKLGDHVTKGQTVARLDNEYADANLKAAGAKVSADEQALDDAYYQKDHPQKQSTTTAAAPAQAPAAANSPATSQQQLAQQQAAQQQAAQQQAAQQQAAQQQAAQQQAAQQRQRSPGLLGTSNFSGGDRGVEDARPQADQGTGGTTGGSTGGSTTSPSGTSGTSGTTAQTSADPGEAQVRNAQATLDQDKAARINAYQATQNLDLVAPEDGTVVSLDGLVGQLAGPQGIVLSSTATGNPGGGRLPDGSAISSGAGSGQSTTTGGSTSASGTSGAGGSAAGGTSTSSSATAAQGAPAVMTIANLGAMQVLAQVPELDVGKVADGQPVAVSVNALQGRKIPGSVTSINLLPGSQSTVQYGTAVLMPAPPPGLRPGMSASVSITTRQADDVTFLPSVAVTPVGGPDSGQATVQVLQPDGTTAPRTIGTGLASDTVTQVTSGLSLGDLVVLPTSAPAPLPPGGPRNPNGGGNGGGGAGGAGR